MIFADLHTNSCTLALPEDTVGTYTLEHIIQKWGKGELTEAQVIGQLLLVVQEVKKQLTEIESKLLCLERTAKR